MSQILKADEGPENGVLIRGVPIAVVHPGKFYYVGNSVGGTFVDGEVVASDKSGSGSFLAPYATISYAISQCIPGRGDQILVRPGYTLTLNDAVTLQLNVAGVSIKGLGVGNDRPTITYANTAANIPVSANDCLIENIVLVPSVASVVAGITVTASGARIYVDSRDASSSLSFISPLVLNGTHDFVGEWRHRGNASTSTMTRGVDIINCGDVRLDLDFYGNASVAVVNMRTTASTNVEVAGRFNNQALALSKNVVDSTGTSLWSVTGYDANGGQNFLGSSQQAVNYANQLNFNALPRCAASTPKVLATGQTTAFTISGGPIQVLGIYGICTTAVQAQATSTQLQLTTVSPAATVNVSAAAVDLTGIAVGTSIRHINTTGILTPVTAGFVNEGNAFATNDTQYFMPPGTLLVNNASASNTGAITWYLRYVPLSSNVTVV